MEGAKPLRDQSHANRREATMSDRDSGSGFLGAIEALLAIIGALTVMGVVAVAASVLAWEMELRNSEQNGQLAEPTTPSKTV